MNKHKKKYNAWNFEKTWYPVTEEYVRDNINAIIETNAWDNILNNSHFSEEFLREFKEYFNPAGIVLTQKVSVDFIRELMEENNETFWRNLSSSENINEKVFNEFKYDLHWTNILQDQEKNISIEQVERYFYDILSYITEPTAYEWEKDALSTYPNLTEQFIEEHEQWLDWALLSIYQKMSEKFMDKHWDKLNWKGVAENQKMGINFISKHKNTLVLDYLRRNTSIAPYIRKKLKGILK